MSIKEVCSDSREFFKNKDMEQFAVLHQIHKYRFHLKLTGKLYLTCKYPEKTDKQNRTKSCKTKALNKQRT